MVSTQKASLAKSQHKSMLTELLELDVSRDVIQYVIDCTIDAVDFALGRASTSSRGRTPCRSPAKIDFINFVTRIVTRAEVTISVLLGALVYISRVRPYLRIHLEDWAYERVLLGALVCASKYLNDSSPKNAHWAIYTGVFGMRDVGLVEREFLTVLDFDMAISEADLVALHHQLFAATVHRRPRQHRRRLVREDVLEPLESSSLVSPCPDLEPSSPVSSPSPSLIITPPPVLSMAHSAAPNTKQPRLARPAVALPPHASSGIIWPSP